MTRLNDSKAQEAFYNKIVERYMKFCAASGADLENQFALLSLHPFPFNNVAKPELNENSVSKAKVVPNGPLVPGANSPSKTEEPAPDLQLILMAMRKLRESVVATRRRDLFAQRCYIFIVRVAVLVCAWESYLPALTHLLHDIHPVTPLDVLELHELVSFQILDYACRLKDFHTAYRVKIAYGIRDRKVAAVLQSLARDDWIAFWRVRRKVDGYQRAIVGFAEGEVRLRALKCMGKTYFSAEKAFLEAMADQEWEKLVKGGLGWELGENDIVTIRKAKAK